MKNIETILSDIELDEEVKAKVIAEVKENYKTVADWQKQKDKVENLESTLGETKAALTKFEGIDAEALQKQIAELTATIANNEASYQQKMSDRDFNDMVKEIITENRGLNAKAIMSLLDVDTLKASQNQKEDITSAIASLKEAEDSKMLFGTDAQVVDKINPIGSIKVQTKSQSTLDDIYKGNPYYHPPKLT